MSGDPATAASRSPQVLAAGGTPLHAWLVAHAHAFGFHPYKTEPWHWEYPVSLAAYRSGTIAADDEGPPTDALAFGLGEEEDAVLEDSDLEELPDGASAVERAR